MRTVSFAFGSLIFFRVLGRTIRAARRRDLPLLPRRLLWVSCPRDGFLVEARRRRGFAFANRSAQIGFLYLRSSVLSVVKAVAMLLVVFPPPWRRTAALEMLQAELFFSLELILLCVVASLRKRASLFGMGSLVLPLVAVPSEA
ncbi:unnamed protein product, partial [Prorocentrum cordatum]